MKAAEIVSAITANPVVIIRGNTGCGKTTQVRKEGGREEEDMILSADHRFHSSFWIT